MSILKVSLMLLALSAPRAFAWDAKNFKKPPTEQLKKKLNDTQFRVTQQADTEQPFHNEFWHNEEEGIYVDVVSGEPLFSSLDKFDSGTGWPSFSKPLVKEVLVEKTDYETGYPRTEVRSRLANSHLGHVFKDGPKPTGLRYCMNSASLRFIPKAKLKEAGYGEFAPLFEKTETATFAAGCFWGTEEFFLKCNSGCGEHSCRLCWRHDGESKI